MWAVLLWCRRCHEDIFCRRDDNHWSPFTESTFHFPCLDYCTKHNVITKPRAASPPKHRTCCIIRLLYSKYRPDLFPWLRCIYTLLYILLYTLRTEGFGQCNCPNVSYAHEFYLFFSKSNIIHKLLTIMKRWLFTIMVGFFLYRCVLIVIQFLWLVQKPMT